MAKVARDMGATLAITVPGLVVAVMGALALAGWLRGAPAFIATMEGSPPMVASTAFGLLVAGIGVMASALCGPRARAVRHGAGAILLLLALLAGAQRLSGADLGIDFPHLHRGFAFSEELPGRMSLPTALALLISCLLLHLHDRPGNRFWALAVQLLAGSLLAIGIASLVAYDVRPEGIFPLYRYSRMAPTTAGAVVALGIAFLALIGRAPWYANVYAHRADERILILVLGILTLVLVGVGAAALAVLQRHMESTVNTALDGAVETRTAILDNLFAARIVRASIVASRPSTEVLLSQWEGAGTPQLRERLREEAASYVGRGFRAIAFFDEHGVPVAEVGRHAGEPTLEVPLKVQRAEATLLWDDAFVVRTFSPVHRNGAWVGSVLTEQEIEVLPRLQLEGGEIAASAEWVMCAALGNDSMGCFPQRFSNHPYVVERRHQAPVPPVVRALEGQRGVANATDERGRSIIAAYGPVGTTGLGVSLRIDTAEYYAPLRSQVWRWGQWFFAMAMVGTLLVASQVRPVAQRLVQSEELARSRSEALARSERELRELYASLGDGVMVFRPDGTIEFANPAAARIFGWPEDELVGKPVSVLIPEGGLREANALATRAFAATGESALVGKRGLVFPAVRRDGSRVEIEFSLAQMGQEPALRLVGVVRDVTEREALDRMKAEFVGAVSHELRTPLTSIIASLELVAEEGLAEPHQGMVDVARRNAARLAKLVDDVIDSSRLDSGSLRFDVSRFAIAEAAAEAVELNGDYARARAVALRLEDESGGMQVEADRGRVAQVFANLISNAAKFSPEGSEVRVRVSRAGEMARVEVADRGRGIPDEFRPRIFQRFEQADASDAREKGGTGLGLAITKGLVEHMGGRIGFESRVGEGTTFWFELPAR